MTAQELLRRQQESRIISTAAYPLPSEIKARIIDEYLPAPFYEHLPAPSCEPTNGAFLLDDFPLRCPFCAAKAETGHDDAVGNYITCERTQRGECYVLFCSKNLSHEELIAHWNKRSRISADMLEMSQIIARYRKTLESRDQLINELRKQLSDAQKEDADASEN